ncbi:MAG: D-alanyl-D-alanine carboxypeptidase [Deltaproteobacteria bacterium]|jgi:D-alanyl-D-alanine carboxypeptidase (penicillin-binding protein 5/6)|nr:D-alanyl-D-alanine carboxypeptidase [Deltaproteobacteria bacterium]MDA8306057.1 D-alanyl-D-alanine carboxypeptidase [Deltaproteobacteria bacterium]
MRRDSFFGLTLMLSFAFLVASMLSPITACGRTMRRKAHAGPKAGALQQSAAGANPVISGYGPANGVSPGVINARSAILMEVPTGTVLFEQNPEELIAPASLTKIMTLYLIFQALKQGRVHLDDRVLISHNAWRTGGSRMFVQVGTRVFLKDLIDGIAVDSGNDACVAAAEYLSGSTTAFVQAMNVEAQKLGMTHTRFFTPDGLPVDGQVTTVGDMAILDRAFIQKFPQALQYTSKKEFKFDNIQQYNRNRLLFQYPYIDGLKTGYVAAGGYHLSVTGYRDGVRLLAIIMGADSPQMRTREAIRLLNYGYNDFTIVTPFPKDQPVAKVGVWKGQKNEVELYPVSEASFLIVRNQKDLLKWQVQAPSDITAPVAANQPIGKIVFTVSDKPERTIELVSREAVPPAGWFKLGRQALEMRVHGLSWKWLNWILGVVAVALIFLLLLTGRRSGGKKRRRW